MPIQIILNIINSMFILIGVLKSILIRQRIIIRELKALTDTRALDESLVLVGENIDVLESLEGKLAKQKEQLK